MGKWKSNKHSHQFKDITGHKFGLLTVVKVSTATGADRHSQWSCICDCGNEVTVAGRYLRTGRTKSCGCLKAARFKVMLTKHGQAGSIEYHSWQSAKSRCFNPNDKHYPDYGARGIAMCVKWKDSFQAFIEDMGPRPTKAHTLDRIDNDGDYEPTNCRWATKDVQANNRRVTIMIVHQGQVIPLSRLAALMGVGYHTLKAKFYKHPELFQRP